MNRILIVLLLGIFVSSLGCKNQKSVVTKYYVLETPGDTTLVDTTYEVHIDEFCEVAQVEIYPAFSTRRIANRSHSNEITYYTSHEWAVRPSEVLTNMLVDYTNDKGLFKRVAERFWEVSPKYKIETTIYQLEVVKQDNDLAAHLHLEFRLIDNVSQKVIAKYEADQTNLLEDKKINLFAATISKMFYSAMNDFSARIGNTLK
jgi:ABC-type uncharacterized transport system auxiliary subunit